MIKYSIIVFSSLLVINGCKNKKDFNSESLKKVNSDYSRFQSKFDKSLINHFPKTVTHIENFLSCNTDLKRNDVGLYLVEKNLSNEEIKELEIKVLSYSPQAKYSLTDSCILKINRFVTFESIESNKPIWIDTALVNKACYRDKFPVPNFMDYSIENNTNFWKKEDFITYVIDAKSGKYFNEFDLQPDEQMPKEWKNGLSKGIAINRKKRIVIYWGVVW